MGFPIYMVDPGNLIDAEIRDKTFSEPSVRVLNAPPFFQKVPEEVSVVLLVSDNPFDLNLKRQRRHIESISDLPQILLLVDCPFDFVGVDEFHTIVRYDRAKPLEVHNEIATLCHRFSKTANRPANPFLGISDSAAAIRTAIKQACQSNDAVCISGEFGTGRTLIARNIHSSQNRDQFVHVAESSNSSVTKKPFSGYSKPPCSYIADLDSTWFIQPDLISKIQKESMIKKNDRVMVPCLSTDQLRTINSMNNAFGDLVTIQSPSLRDRRSDILEIAAETFVEAGSSLGLGELQMDSSSQAVCQEYYWPGNYRELKLVLLGGALFSESRIVTGDGIVPWLIDSERRYVCSENGTKLDSRDLRQKCVNLQHRLQLALSRRLRAKDAVASLMQNLFVDQPIGVEFQDLSSNEQSLPEAA